MGAPSWAPISFVGQIAARRSGEAAAPLKPRSLDTYLTHRPADDYLLGINGEQANGYVLFPRPCDVSVDAFDPCVCRLVVA